MYIYILVIISLYLSRLFSTYSPIALPPAGLLSDLVSVDVDRYRLNLLTDRL